VIVGVAAIAVLANVGAVRRLRAIATAITPAPLENGSTCSTVVKARAG
jgi:hypothetical protein